MWILRPTTAWFNVLNPRVRLAHTRGSPASADLQGGGVFSVVVGLYDVHVLIEGDEEAQKALHGELAEVAAQHPGDIGLAGAEQSGDLDLSQAGFSRIVSILKTSCASPNQGVSLKTTPTLKAPP